MKLKYAVLPAAVAMLFSAASMADTTGTITFNGVIKAPTCEVDGGANLDINLGEFEVNQFTKTGTEVKANQDVVINLKNCTATTVRLKIDSANPYSFDKIRVDGAGSAQGVAIVLKRYKGPKDNNISIDNSHAFSESVGSANKQTKFTLYPYIHQVTDTVTAGSIKATATYNISYL